LSFANSSSLEYIIALPLFTGNSRPSCEGLPVNHQWLQFCYTQVQVGVRVDWEEEWRDSHVRWERQGRRKGTRRVGPNVENGMVCRASSLSLSLSLSLARHHLISLFLLYPSLTSCWQAPGWTEPCSQSVKDRTTPVNNVTVCLGCWPNKANTTSRHLLS